VDHATEDARKYACPPAVAAATLKRAPPPRDRAHRGGDRLPVRPKWSRTALAAVVTTVTGPRRRRCRWWGTCVSSRLAGWPGSRRRRVSRPQSLYVVHTHSRTRDRREKIILYYTVIIVIIIIAI